MTINGTEDERNDRLEALKKAMPKGSKNLKPNMRNISRYLCGHRDVAWAKNIIDKAKKKSAKKAATANATADATASATVSV